MEFAKNIRIDSVSRLQPVAPVKLGPQESVAKAIAEMQKHRVGAVLLCEGSKLVGIFTERDLLRRVLGPGKALSILLKDCMTPNPVSVQSKESVATALRKMEEGGYRHLPVVDEAGHPVGMLSVKRIIHYLVEHFPSTVYNLPPNPSASQKDREGA
jgi:CBS domain-containing protein